jgi:hypothetical protein
MTSRGSSDVMINERRKSRTSDKRWLGVVQDEWAKLSGDGPMRDSRGVPRWPRISERSWSKVIQIGEGRDTPRRTGEHGQGCGDGAVPWWLGWRHRDVPVEEMRQEWEHSKRQKRSKAAKLTYKRVHMFSTFGKMPLQLWSLHSHNYGWYPRL